MSRRTPRVGAAFALVVALTLGPEILVALGDDKVVTPGYIPAPLSAGPGTVPHPAGPVEVVVVRGDNMWKLAQRRIEEVSPHSAVSPYWRTVVEANRGSIRSGNPDLIYPGEILELPALETGSP